MGVESAQRTAGSASGSPTIPNPDYNSHAAYGKLFGRPKLSARVEALKKWRAGYRQIMPNVRATAAKTGASPMRLLWRSDIPAAQSNGEQPPLLGDLVRDGAVAIRLTQQEMDAVSRAADPFVQRLQAKRAQTPDGKRLFRDNQLGIPRDEGADLHARVCEALESHGLFDTASRYLGFTVRPDVDINLQINGASDTSFWDSGFKDLQLPYPKTTYMHIDTDVGVLKCLLYLNTVTEKNGPFRYVIGSHRKIGLFERIVRKANDVSGLDSRGRESRELFWALPRVLRRKAAFGYDLSDSSPEADTLLRNEHAFTSDEGSLIFFDGDRGIHRGAMVQEGERQMLQIVLR